jgi:hypothetical protein
MELAQGFDLGIFDKTEKKILGQALDLRNSCGDPSVQAQGEEGLQFHRGRGRDRLLGSQPLLADGGFPDDELHDQALPDNTPGSDATISGAQGLAR